MNCFYKNKKKNKSFMENYLKIKKRKIILVFLLIFNHLTLSSYSLNERNSDLIENNDANSLEKYGRNFKRLVSNKTENDENSQNKEVEDIEKFIEETFDSNNVDNLKNQIEQNSINETNSNEIDKEKF